MSATPKNKEEVVSLCKEMKDLSIKDIFVLLGPQEIIELFGDANFLEKEYKHYNFNVIQFPIRDYSVPNSMERFDRLIRIIISFLNKENVLVHCWGGHGRTGVVAISVLIRLGRDYKDAYRYVYGIRPVIDNEEQFIFLQKYQEYCKKGNRDDKIRRGRP